jgi:demethylmenaquinone methyltransferase/2-methoxy-6-polyprenyl-1,4-benzoquinol methylase
VDVANLTGQDRATYVQNMFSQIAERYDLMNGIMTFGQDKRWRKEVLCKAGIQAGGYLLDLGAGTGDLAFDALALQPDIIAVAADFTLEMMLVGQKRDFQDNKPARNLSWSAADAVKLPFRDEVFDMTVSGFLYRNVINLDRCLKEQFRILKSGGRIAALDTMPSRKQAIEPLIRCYTQKIIPRLGDLIAGNADAYTYLPESTQRFLKPESLARRMEEAGFIHIGFARRMFDTVAIYWGTKPETPQNY